MPRRVTSARGNKNGTEVKNDTEIKVHLLNSNKKYIVVKNFSKKWLKSKKKYRAWLSSLNAGFNLFILSAVSFLDPTKNSSRKQLNLVNKLNRHDMYIISDKEWDYETTKLRNKLETLLPQSFSSHDCFLGAHLDFPFFSVMVETMPFKERERIYVRGKQFSWAQLRTQTVSSNVLYIHPLYLSFTVFSKRFHPLYLISLQQHSLNHVLYTQIPILKIFLNFIFLYVRIYHTLKYIVHILVLLNRLFKVVKWMEDRLEKLYI
jgi:hypothetical protein